MKQHYNLVASHVPNYGAGFFYGSQDWLKTGPTSWRMVLPYYLNADLHIKLLTEELRQAKEAAAFWELAATTDSLTQLRSRFVLDRLDAEFQKSPNKHREENPSDAIVFIDLDDFGLINKKHGDHIGDRALALIGMKIKEAIRSDDLAIRKGGDEFIILLRGANAQAANATVVQRIREILNGEIVIECETGTFAVRGSVGVYDYDPAKAPLANITEADAQMRKDKAARKATALAEAPATPETGAAPPPPDPAS